MYFCVLLCGVKKKQKMIKQQSSGNSNSSSSNKSNTKTSQANNDDEKEAAQDTSSTVYAILMQNFDGTDYEDVMISKNHTLLIGITKEKAIQQANKMFYDWIFKSVSENYEEEKELKQKFKLSDIRTYDEDFFRELFCADSAPCMYDSFASLLVYEWNLDASDNEKNKKTLIHQIPKHCKTA